MAFYKMKLFGSYTGLKSGIAYHFDKDQIIEAPQGEFNNSIAEFSEKREIEVSGKHVETAAMNPKAEKRKGKGK